MYCLLIIYFIINFFEKLVLHRKVMRSTDSCLFGMLVSFLMWRLVLTHFANYTGQHFPEGTKSSFISDGDESFTR